MDQPNPPTCTLCGETLVRTSEAFGCCPRNHGPLVPWPGHLDRAAVKEEQRKMKERMKEAGL